MRRAVDWLLREQIPDDAPGDWRMKCADERGNGWAFEFDNDAYPDIDDTTIVVLALLEGGDRDEGRDVGRTRAALDARDATRATARGRPSIATTRASCSIGCRSPISAR